MKDFDKNVTAIVTKKVIWQSKEKREKEYSLPIKQRV